MKLIFQARVSRRAPSSGGSNIVGSAIEAKLGNSFATPYLREAGTNVFDKFYDTLGKENNEKK